MARLDLPLLRSVFVLPGDPPGDVLTNLTALRQDVLPEGIDAHLLNFVGGLADKAGTAPALTLVQQHYQTLTGQGDANGMAGSIRLDEIAQSGLPFLPSTDYRYTLDQFREKILGEGVATIIQQVSSILTTGYTPPPVRGKPSPLLKGAEMAIQFIEQGLTNLTGQFKTTAAEGSFKDVSDVYARYQAQVGKPPSGVKTGFRDIDLAHAGMQYGDLALILGFTGQMKSTLTFNIAYNTVVFHANNAGIISMEMSARGLRDAMVVMHCMHPKFGATRFATLTYDRLRAGTLTADEEALVQEAIHDLKTCKDYGQFVYFDPDRDLTVSDVRRWAEQEHRKTPLDLLAIDYIGLINPSGGGVSMKESAYANIAIRETKQMARTFDRGRGVAVISPFQSNRQGFKDAQKRGGQYELAALAWAPEAEKSADLVYTVYQDDVLRGMNQLQIGNIKARDRRLIEHSFTVFALADHKRIEDMDPSKIHQQRVPVVDMDGLPQP